jgi:hypothetical protein
VDSLPRRTQRAISISRADIKTQRTNSRLIEKPQTAQPRNCPKHIGLIQENGQPKMTDLGLSYQALKTMMTAAKGQQPRSVPAAARRSPAAA